MTSCFQRFNDRSFVNYLDEEMRERDALRKEVGRQYEDRR